MLAVVGWTRRLWSEGALGRIADNRTRTLGKGEPKSRGDEPEVTKRSLRNQSRDFNSKLSGANGTEPRTNDRIPPAVECSLAPPAANPLTSDMSGRPQAAKLAVGCPLDAGVRRHGVQALRCWLGAEWQRCGRKKGGRRIRPLTGQATKAPEVSARSTLSTS